MAGENNSRSGYGSDIPSETRPRYLSPTRLFLIISATVFFGEVVVMFVLAGLPEMSMFVEALADGIMITIIVTPALILFLMRPMVLHINRREIAEEKLRRLNDILEDRVEERTTELTAANEQLRREIGDRKSAESGLTKSSEFIDRILGSAPCVLAIYDVNSMACSFINDSVENLLGYSPDDVVLKGAGFFQEIFSEQDFASFQELNSRMAAGIDGEILKCECQLQTADSSMHSFGIGLVVIYRTPENQPKDVLLAAVPTRESWPEIQNGLSD